MLNYQATYLGSLEILEAVETLIVLSSDFPVQGECKAKAAKATTINAIPAPTKDTASIKLVNTAEGAITVIPGALESYASGMARYGPLSTTKECCRGQGWV